jgi:septum formation protein
VLVSGFVFRASDLQEKGFVTESAGIPRIILASASPRRRDLMTEAGYAFEVVVAEVDESAIAIEGHDAVRHAEFLALAKARDVARRFPDRIVVGADTVVDFQGQIIGKPADAADAARITRMLFSAPHRVVTGLAILWQQKGVEIVRSDITTVYPRTMTAEQLTRHIEGGTWEGKAGAYAIQEGGDEFVDHIEGSFTNVVGLPMELLKRLFDDLRSQFA